MESNLSTGAILTKPLDWEPVIANFRATHATLEQEIRFRMILDPYPNGVWADKFNKDYPVLPPGANSWFRSPGIIEIDCPLGMLRNVKRKLQTHTNEVNIWFEKHVLPPLIEKEEAAIAQAKKIEEIVAHANSVLEEQYTSGLFKE